jgi:membrane-associated phospholipid phosphatase
MIREKQFCVIVLCLTKLSWQTDGHTQVLQSPQHPSPRKSFTATVSGDVAHVFSSPFCLQPKDGFKLLAFTAGTIVFVSWLDGRIDASFIARDDFYVIPAKELAKFGEGYGQISIEYVLMGLPLSMLAGGLILDDKKLLETTRLMLESFVIAGAITQLGKTVFGRARPYTGEAPTEFEWPELGLTSETRSFPSGHTATAFSIMTVLAKQYNHWWIKIPAYTVAVSVALQRIESRNHWGADVVAGGALGYWIGNALVTRYKKQPSRNLSVNPSISTNQVGLSVEF